MMVVIEKPTIYKTKIIEKWDLSMITVYYCDYFVFSVNFLFLAS